MQLFAITGHNGDLAAAPRSSDIEEFLLHSVRRYDNPVHSFALAPMRSDSVTMIERAVVRRNGTAILQLNAFPFDTMDFDQFSIGGTEFSIPAIAGQQ